MKTHKADDEDSIRALLEYLNVCHDGSLRRISFVKDRELTEDGNLIIFSSEMLVKGDCEIEAELLLNSYIGASPTQVVILNFQDVRSFRLYQDNNFDYSDIYMRSTSVVPANICLSSHSAQLKKRSSS